MIELAFKLQTHIDVRATVYYQLLASVHLGGPCARAPLTTRVRWDQLTRTTPGVTHHFLLSHNPQLAAALRPSLAAEGIK
ncbi:hypothetical protein FKM82_016417 [Ascaphus truei]